MYSIVTIVLSVIFALLLDFFFLIHNFEFRRYLYLLSIIFRISLFFCRMTREEFEVPISKEDWNKFIIATALCAFIILIQIIINFI